MGITGDAVLQKINDVWVRFYFGTFWETRKDETFNCFACKAAVYHFYCAVDNKDHRGIAVATSVDKGISKLQFAK